jgi:hypothetical protein
MNQSIPIQPWKLNSTVTEFIIAKAAEAGTRNEPHNGRANFYPAGELMFDGGQGAGDGGQRQPLYDTENRKKEGEVSGEGTKRS